MNLVTDILKKGKNVVLREPEIVVLVKDATSNEKWGTSGTIMRQISEATYNPVDYPLIGTVIWKRLNDSGKNWRHVYKTLLLLDYLLRNGSERVILECRARIIEIKTLFEFQHIDEHDKDVGSSVRERAKQIVELLVDDKRLKAERKKSAANRGKWVGMGSGDRMHDPFNRGGGGFGGESSRPIRQESEPEEAEESVEESLSEEEAAPPNKTKTKAKTKTKTKTKPKEPKEPKPTKEKEPNIVQTPNAGNLVSFANSSQQNTVFDPFNQQMGQNRGQGNVGSFEFNPRGAPGSGNASLFPPPNSPPNVVNTTDTDWAEFTRAPSTPINSNSNLLMQPNTLSPISQPLSPTPVSQPPKSNIGFDLLGPTSTGIASNKLTQPDKKEPPGPNDPWSHANLINLNALSNEEREKK